MGAPALTYSVSPASAPCSASESELSVVDLTITGTNGGDTPVSLSAIDIQIPGSGWSTSGDLPYDPATIAAAPGSATPWAIAGAGDGTWRALPLPPATAIAAQAAVSFVFTGVVVNLVPDDGAVLPIVEWQGQDQAAAQVTVEKTEATGPYVQAPTVTSFAADPPQVGLGQPSTLAWQVAGVAHDGSDGLVTLTSNPPATSPDPVPLTPPDAGSLQVAPSATTVFTLRAQTSGGSALATAVVTVMPVAIASFTATPATVAPGGTVTLAWEVAFAGSCSIDHGVGPVSATTGSQPVTPAQTTVYTLTTTGLTPQQASVVVSVTH